MAGQGLASLGSGISETYFAGLAEQRQEEQKKQDKDLAYKLAALHALMDHADTPENSIPDLLDMQGDLLKAPKEFKAVTQRMREAMQHQVPSGPERETAQSGVDRTVASSTAIGPTTDTLATGLNLRATNATATSPGTVPTMPETAPQTITSPALSVVPTAPQMYQPTRAYGELTQGEAQDYRKNTAYNLQQEALLRKSLGLQESANIARDKRQDDQQAAREREIQLRGDESRKTQTERFKSQLNMLDPAQRAKANLRVYEIAASLPVGLDPTERDRLAREQAGAEIQLTVEQKKQQIAQSKETMKRMGILNQATFEQIRKSKETGVGLGAGMSAATKREFDLRTKTLQDQLSSVLRQIEAAEKKEMDEGPDPLLIATKERLEQDKSELWAKIDSARNEILTRSSVSRVPGVPLDPALEQRIRDAATAKGLDPDTAVLRARARQ